MSLVLVVLVVTIGIGIVRSAGSPTVVVPVEPSASAQMSEAIADAGPAAPVEDVFVHVSGRVRQPGLYVLSAGSRVVDAISAAGGFSDEADPSAVNLARPIIDGEQVHIPAPGEAPSAGAAGEGAAGGGAVGSGAVDLNAADAAALDTLPRIGPAIAQRIIDWREQNGPFTSVEDLLAVPGIGEKLLAGLRDRVRV